MLKMSDGDTVKIHGRPWILEISGRGYVMLKEQEGEQRTATKHMHHETKESLANKCYEGDDSGWQSEMNRLIDEVIKEARALVRKDRSCKK